MYPPHESKFVVDCEYDGKTKTLISMAIVPLWSNHFDMYSMFEQVDEDREFYEVITPLPSDMSEWVQENVVPRLQKTGISFLQFQEKLEEFLLKHKVKELHYDWVEDIAYVNFALVTGPGERLKIPVCGTSYSRPVSQLAHIFHSGISYSGTNQHNALSDARSIAAVIRQRFLGPP